MDGVVKVNKPLLYTSMDCVEEVKESLGIEKAGHTGTLDPHAEGLLLICLNSATKLVPFLTDLDKEYEGEAILGLKTTTGDRGGEIIEERSKRVSMEDVLETIERFKGEITQTPPIYSAVKMGGRRLYEYARMGISDLKLKPRKVKVYDFDLLSFEEDEAFQRFSFRIRCSKGTYVRKIVEDIGEELGTGAFLSHLKRIRIGPFDLGNAARPWDREALIRFYMSIERVLSEIMPVLEISPKEAIRISNGNLIKRSSHKKGFLALTFKGKALAIAKSTGDFIKPVRVLK